MALEAPRANARLRRHLRVAAAPGEDKVQRGEANDSHKPDEPDHEAQRVAQYGFHCGRAQFPYRVLTASGSASRSSHVRKSIVLKCRSSAGGPQIFAPIL